MSVKTFTGNEGTREQPDNLLWIGLIAARYFRPQNVSLGGTALKLPSIPLSKRRTLMIFNNSSDIIYVGDSTVTTTNGFPIYQRVTTVINVEDNIDIYGVSAGAASDIRICESG